MNSSHPSSTPLVAWLEAAAARRPRGFLEQEAIYVLRWGKSFMPTPQALTTEPGRPKECFVNALDAVFSNETALRYCEGWAMTRTGPVQHAWVTTAGSDALEVTWAEPSREYFGVALSPVRLHDVVEATAAAFGPVVRWLAQQDLSPGSDGDLGR